jgi:hypothetical protein
MFFNVSLDRADLRRAYSALAKAVSGTLLQLFNYLFTDLSSYQQLSDERCRENQDIWWSRGMVGSRKSSRMHYLASLPFSHTQLILSSIAQSVL